MCIQIGKQWTWITIIATPVFQDSNTQRGRATSPGTLLIPDNTMGSDVLGNTSLQVESASNTWSLRSSYMLQHLKGPIPTGGQFTTFPDSSLDGNPKLCCAMLAQHCNSAEAVLPPASSSLTKEQTYERPYLWLPFVRSLL